MKYKNKLYISDRCENEICCGWFHLYTWIEQNENVLNNSMCFDWTEYAVLPNQGDADDFLNTFVNAVSNQSIKYSTWLFWYFKQVYTPLKPCVC